MNLLTAISSGLLICTAVFSGATAGESDIKKYSGLMAQCAVKAIPNFDDGITQANIIAEVIWQTCTGKVGEAIRDHALAGQNASFITSYADAQKTLFTGYVLQHRVAKQ